MDPHLAPVKEAGIVVAALLAAAAVLGRSPRASAAAALAALAATPVLLLAQIWDSEQLAPLRDRPALFAGLGAAALLLVAAGAWGLRRQPTALPVAAALALPFRVPVASGGSTANLLVPLYLVIAAGVLAWAVPRLRDPGPGAGHRGERALEWALMGFVVLYAVQSAYSDDVDKALEQVVFFYVPFALLYAALRRQEWTPGVVRACLGALTGLAVVFAAVGFWEYGAKELLLAPEVVAADRFEEHFRVQSLFFDPNIYGRFLAVVMLCVTAAMLWSPRTRTSLTGGLVLAILWGGLVLTFSQSSFAGLLAGLAVLAALRWSVRWTVVAAGAAAVTAAAIVLAFPGALRIELGSSKSADTATSGRVELLEGGAELFAERPVLGWGSGAFERVYRREQATSSLRAVAASHTIPVTVAAEQGVPGLLAYLGLVGLALLALLRRAGRSAARAAVAAAFVALLVHTLLYAAFLEDPLAWFLLAAGVALRRAEPDGA